VSLESVEVKPVANSGELRSFIKLPFTLHSKSSPWVPQLIIDQKKRFNRDKNPFFKHAEAEYFLAYRDGRPVGRISAHIDHTFNKFHDHRWGLFGFFECEDNQATADALFQAASNWLKVKGQDVVVGPMSFTTNDECGMLIEGFDRRPALLTPWNPQYYNKLTENGGFEKEMDLLMWHLDWKKRSDVKPAIFAAADHVRDEHGVTIRTIDKKNLAAEIATFMDIYNASWVRNWGFAPLTEEEITHMAKELKPLLDERWVCFAEKDGEAIGAGLALPDFNQVLKKLNGRLLPTGWLKGLINKSKIDAVRVVALGIKPEYHELGVGASIYRHYWEMSATTDMDGEAGWVLETNKAMNRAMEGMGSKLVSRYRIYKQQL